MVPDWKLLRPSILTLEVASLSKLTKGDFSFSETRIRVYIYIYVRLYTISDERNKMRASR